METLPSNWVEATVEQLVVVGPRNYMPDDVIAGFIPLALLGTHFNDEPRYEERRWEKIKSGFTHLADGDVVVARITPSFENGKAGVVRDLPNSVGSGSTEYIVCRPIPRGINPKYLLAIFKQRTFLNEGILRMSGAVGQQRIPKAFVAQTRVALPPEEEQIRIVNKLEKLFSLTQAIKRRGALLARKTSNFRKGVLDAAISGELTKRWRLANPDATAGDRLLDEVLSDHALSRENKATYSTKALSECDLPVSWCVVRAEHVVQPDAPIVYGIVQPGPQVQDGVPYVRGMDIVDEVIKLEQLAKTDRSIAARYARSSLRGGDVLLGIIRATKVALVPEALEGGNITQGTARFRPSRHVLSEYLAIALRAPGIQSWLHAHYRGIDMPGLNLTDVRLLPIPVPPLAEQREIVVQVKRRFRVASDVGRFTATSAEKADELEQRILSLALAGLLIPNDEAEGAVDMRTVRQGFEAYARAQQEQRQSMKIRPKIKWDQQSFLNAVRVLGEDELSSQQLQEKLGIDYETFQPLLFSVLSKADGPISQFFDAKRRAMRLRIKL